MPHAFLSLFPGPRAFFSIYILESYPSDEF